MAWLKITHTGGWETINLDQVYRIAETASTDLTFYDANSILPTTYTFASSAEKDEFLQKFESIIRLIDIDKLAQQ